MTDDRDPVDRIDEYVRTNPDADPVEVLGTLGLSPEYRDDVERALGVESDDGQDTGADDGESINYNPGCDTGDVVKTESPENRPPEPDSPDANPGENADASGSTTPSDPLAAFADAVEWYHQQLDTEIPVDYADTARDYYETVRGWDPDTVDEKRLGYAPGDSKDELLAYLYDQGHDREAIQASGLFYEDDLYPHFNGRFVLPYADADGSPVYAISRSLDEDNGGHPADHHGDQKYTKAIKGKDYSKIDEPIYGLSSVDQDTDRLLVAGGIADAITLHEAGYACISPVTTVRFKNKHEARVLDLVDTYDIDGVYIVNDAERPTNDAQHDEGVYTASTPDLPTVEDRIKHGFEWLFDTVEHDTIGDVLAIQAWGEGLRGAFGTAEFLAKADVDTYLVDLPGGDDDLRKLDPDDYLKEGWGSVETLLASSRPADEHPDYAKWKDSRRSRAVAKARQNDPSKASTDGDASALYDLGFCEVSGLSGGFRGTNPLGHHGESEDYFVVIDDRNTELGYDHKYGVAYNGLTYLACEAGERRANDPQGSFTPDEILGTWVHAKDTDEIDDDDPIPRRALRAVARDATEWDGDLVEHETRDGGTFDGLPADVYNAALDAVREQYDREPGREPAGSGGDDVEHTAVFPPAVRDLTPATSGWDWRHSAQADDTLTVDEARERTVEAIAEAYDSYDHVLVEALPTMGKSYGAVKAAAETGEPVTILTGRGRKEQYAQFKEWAKEHDLDVYELPAFTHDCDTANGEHGQDWAETVRDWYHRGATPKEIHKSAEYVLGEPLPCQRHEGHDCPYKSKWNFDPDDYDILLGHYSHAHKSKVTAGRSVVFDEFPDAYEKDLVVMQGAISYWLSTVDGVPFENYADLRDNRDDEQRRADALLWFDEHGVEPDEGHVFDDSKAHADAPLAVFTLVAGEDLGNGFEQADLGESGVGVYNRESDAVSVLRPPPLTDAPPSRKPSGIVALDGTPTKRMWELALGERLTHRPVLQDGERAEYIDDALNLNFVRTTEYIKSYNSSDHVSVAKDAALLEAVADEHGQRPSLITTATAEEEYDAAGVLDLVDETKHYGNVLGSNEFDETRLGAVVGSNHYGDHYIQKWGAYAGEAVERGEGKGADLEYSGFGDDVLTHMREHDTLQAAMRFGRDGNGAVVYVHTDTLPDWVPLAGEARVVRTRDDGERQVLDAIEGRESWTTTEIANADDVDVGERRVRQILDELAEQGALEKGVSEADARAVEWSDAGVDDLADHVELPDVDDPEGEGNDDRSCGNSRIEHNYTWVSATSPPDRLAEWRERGESPTPADERVADGGVSGGPPLG